MNKAIRLQGIAWDEKSSFLTGSRLAPLLIREHLWSDSTNTYSETGVDVSPLRDGDCGDINPVEYFDIETFTRANYEPGTPIITLGGDHSITFPVVKALAPHIPKLDILHIDAHADLYADFEGDPYSHACPFARIMEAGLVQRLVQVGIRTLNPHQRAQAERYGVEVLEMRHHAQWTLPRFLNPVYLSLDLDGIDPAYAPGVSHHEPGGLSPRQVIDLIQNFEGTLVAADVVEYNPERDVQGITGALAAKLVKELAARLLQ